jgi:hypothetical protein
MIRPLLLFLALGSAGLLHPLHTTHTELEEAEPGVIRIRVRAFTDDLIAAVGTREPVISDSVVARYLRGVLELRRPDGGLAPLKWIGIRPDGDVTLITLGTHLPGGLAGVAVRQAIHTELFSDQVNVVQARYAGRRVSLLFVPGDGSRRLP